MGKKFKLQNSEKLKLLRRRKGLSQKDVSEEHDICISYISQIERDLKEIGDFPDLVPTNLEICWLLRNRRGLLQKELAELIGVSRVSIVNMEKGKQSPEKLINYWGRFYDFY